MFYSEINTFEKDFVRSRFYRENYVESTKAMVILQQHILMKYLFFDMVC